MTGFLVVIAWGVFVSVALLVVNWVESEADAADEAMGEVEEFIAEQAS